MTCNKSHSDESKQSITSLFKTINSLIKDNTRYLGFYEADGTWELCKWFKADKERHHKCYRLSKAALKI